MKFQHKGYSFLTETKNTQTDEFRELIERFDESWTVYCDYDPGLPYETRGYDGCLHYVVATGLTYDAAVALQRSYHDHGPEYHPFIRPDTDGEVEGYKRDVRHVAIYSEPDCFRWLLRDANGVEQRSGKYSNSGQAEDGLYAAIADLQ